MNNKLSKALKSNELDKMTEKDMVSSVGGMPYNVENFAYGFMNRKKDCSEYWLND